VSPRSRHPPATPSAQLPKRAVGIPQRLLLACGSFGPRLSATAVASALGRGIHDAGLPEPDMCVLPTIEDGTDAGQLLDDLGFDVRMRQARAVVIAAERLEERTLAGSITFEIATRARQGGVPAYAVSGENTLDAFDARILDLQVVLQARSRGALVTAGRKLAELS
jgi:glycerate kinase